MDDDTQASKRLYRVDKFLVPDEAREEYLQNLRATHELLRKQPGFVQDFVLEHASGQSAFNFVTIAEWESQGAIDAARLAVLALHREMNLDPPEMFARLGITEDLGRSEARRVGKECVSTCRSRWWPLSKK